MNCDLQYLQNLTLAVHYACKKARVDECISQAFEENLTGACGIASFGLWEKLILNGYYPDFVYGLYRNSDHCWITLDGLTIDVTYSQFYTDNLILISKNNKSYKPCLINRDAIDYLWLWKDQSPKHYYFEWFDKFKCKLYYHDSLLKLNDVL